MTQSHLMSLAESTANVAAGFGIAVLTQVLVFPLFGLNVSLSKNLGIGVVFTVISLVRSYLFRRIFNAVSPSPLRTPINR